MRCAIKLKCSLSPRTKINESNLIASAKGFPISVLLSRRRERIRSAGENRVSERRASKEMRSSTEGTRDQDPQSLFIQVLVFPQDSFRPPLVSVLLFCSTRGREGEKSGERMCGVEGSSIRSSHPLFQTRVPSLRHSLDPD